MLGKPQNPKEDYRHSTDLKKSVSPQLYRRREMAIKVSSEPYALRIQHTKKPLEIMEELSSLELSSTIQSSVT